MNALWRFLAYDALPLISLAVAIGTAVRVFWVLGLRPDALSGVLGRQGEETSFGSTLGQLRGIHPEAPESGLAELGREEANREDVLRTLGAAEVQFRRRIRPLEVWTSASVFLTGVLLFMTLIYAASALRSLMVGLSLEIQHNTTAILDVVNNISVVLFRTAWVVSCLFVLNTVTKLRVSRRKERWAIFTSRLTREVVKG